MEEHVAQWPHHWRLRVSDLEVRKQQSSFEGETNKIKTSQGGWIQMNCARGAQEIKSAWRWLLPKWCVQSLEPCDPGEVCLLLTLKQREFSLLWLFACNVSMTSSLWSKPADVKGRHQIHSFHCPNNSSAFQLDESGSLVSATEVGTMTL